MLWSHLRSNIIGYIALFIALGGTAAVAAPPFIRSGDPAGGDLTGTYPNPAIRAGAVTPEKFGAIPAARVQMISGQAVASSGITPLAFDTESFDTAGLHDNAANNTRLIAPIAGVYQVSAGVFWNDLIESGSRALAIIQNNAPCPAGGCKAESAQPDAGSGFKTVQSVSTLLRLEAGDYIEAGVSQGSGGPLSVEGDPRNSTFLAMTWVGP